MNKRLEGSGSRFSSPAYRRIELDLRRKIQQGLWPIGAMLPSRKDLASEYGVSVPTVERAVSDLLEDGTIRADGGRGTFVASKQKNGNESHLAQERSSDSDYAPKFRADHSHFASASDLRSNLTIGVISYLDTEDRSTRSRDRWQDTIIDSLERFITGQGGSTVFFNQRQADGSRTSLQDSINAIQATGVKAIAVIFETDEAEMARVSPRLERGDAIVFINSSEVTVPVLSVYYDSRQAGYLAAHHLLKRGCRELLFFAPYTADWVLQRAHGARVAVELSGSENCALRLEISPEQMDTVLKSHDHVEAAREQAAVFLAKGQLSGGVVASNDYVAYGFIEAASAVGLKMGVDYSIIGFDDSAQSRHLGLSTLRPPLAALGEEAGKLLSRALHGGNIDISVCLHSHLVARASSILTTPRI